MPLRNTSEKKTRAKEALGRSGADFTCSGSWRWDDLAPRVRLGGGGGVGVFARFGILDSPPMGDHETKPVGSGAERCHGSRLADAGRLVVAPFDFQRKPHQMDGPVFHCARKGLLPNFRSDGPSRSEAFGMLN